MSQIPRKEVTTQDAAQEATLAVAGWVLPDEKAEKGYAYASDVFNKAATPQQKKELERLQEQTKEATWAALDASPEDAPALDHEMDVDRIAENELLAVVLTAAYPQAEAEMARYMRFSADRAGDKLSDLRKMYQDAAAPTLTRIAAAAAAGEPCPSEPTDTHKVFSLGIIKISRQ